jgi:hypothetical protein
LAYIEDGSWFLRFSLVGKKRGSYNFFPYQIGSKQ